MKFVQNYIYIKYSFLVFKLNINKYVVIFPSTCNQWRKHTIHYGKPTIDVVRKNSNTLRRKQVTVLYGENTIHEGGMSKTLRIEYYTLRRKHNPIRKKKIFQGKIYRCSLISIISMLLLTNFKTNSSINIATKTK